MLIILTFAQTFHWALLRSMLRGVRSGDILRGHALGAVLGAVLGAALKCAPGAIDDRYITYLGFTIAS